MAEAEQTIAGLTLIRRKVRTPQGRVLHNVESRQREGKCNRKYTARPLLFAHGEESENSRVRVKWCGKSAPVLRVTGEAW